MQQDTSKSLEKKELLEKFIEPEDLIKRLSSCASPAEIIMKETLREDGIPASSEKELLLFFAQEVTLLKDKIGKSERPVCLDMKLEVKDDDWKNSTRASEALSIMRSVARDIAAHSEEDCNQEIKVFMEAYYGKPVEEAWLDQQEECHKAVRGALQHDQDDWNELIRSIFNTKTSV